MPDLPNRETVGISPALRTSASSKERAVLLLHGHAGSPEAMASVADALATGLGGRVLVPRAPLAVDGGFAWWADDEDGPDASLVQALQEAAQGADELVVVGFSQGGALALALPFGDRLACISGFLPGQPPGHRPSVLIAHGHGDEAVDPHYGRMAARRCRSAGCPVVEHWHDGGHEWLPSVTDAVLAWLA